MGAANRWAPRNLSESIQVAGVVRGFNPAKKIGRNTPRRGLIDSDTGRRFYGFGRGHTLRSFDSSALTPSQKRITVPTERAAQSVYSSALGEVIECGNRSTAARRPERPARNSAAPVTLTSADQRRGVGRSSMPKARPRYGSALPWDNAKAPQLSSIPIGPRGSARTPRRPARPMTEPREAGKRAQVAIEFGSRE
jgi:hypothetical protein